MAYNLIHTDAGGLILIDKPIMVGSELDGVLAQNRNLMILDEQKLGWEEYKLRPLINSGDIVDIRLLFYKRYLEIIEVDLKIESKLYHEYFTSSSQLLSISTETEFYKWGEVNKILEKDRNIAIIIRKRKETSA